MNNPHQPHQCGYAYVLLLLAVAAIGAISSQMVSVGATASRRDAEQALLQIGAEFDIALRSYAAVPQNVAIAATNARGPRTLEELLKDPRNPSIRRHLRQIYSDPLTGKAEWGFVTDTSGFITGVYSLANAQPFKRSNFTIIQTHFEGAETYKQWVFGISTPEQRQNRQSPTPSKPWSNSPRTTPTI